MNDPCTDREAFARVTQAGPDNHDGIVAIRGRHLRCSLGRAGIRRDKREGDGATPAGEFAIRNVLYRADKVALPSLPWRTTAIRPDDGWCDDPANPLYNRPVTHPFAGSAEHLWRDDDLYDVVAVLGYNDAPPVAGRGSAIFMHVASGGYGPTEGCVALAKADLLDLLRMVEFRGLQVVNR